MNVWRDRLHRWLGPLARRCPLSPNAITLLALALSAVAAWLLYSRHFLVAIVIVAMAGLADAFDGIVARVQNKASRFGDFLDHFADRVSDVLLVIGWLLGNHVRVEITVAVVAAVLLNGYIGTQIEATWQERSYDTVGRGEFVLALIVYPIVSHILDRLGQEDLWLGDYLVTEWMALPMLLFAIVGIVQRLIRAARLA
ncbi:MAG TPA: CDP-alcohol phosphatidyltransferase family protein [Thermoanaerobaculia bacterium]|jgi:phosphatidylglycerophosphate synthase